MQMHPKFAEAEGLVYRLSDAFFVEMQMLLRSTGYVYWNPTALHFRRSTLQNKANNSNQNKGPHLGSRYMIVYVLKTVVVSYYTFKSRYFNDRIHMNSRFFSSRVGLPTDQLAV